ncbi:MAG: hypothetical protein D4R64_00620 [Porphyromonadaceae bacterium]|nr:MAG: hypothetical protein D4R64_00620 [Porphyromonadaceae bacterium]
MKRFLKIGIPILMLLLAVMLWWRFCFVFGEGVRAGNLNFLVKKGYIFKTWEGRLIQVGFKTPAPGAMQSNEFDFSVANDSLGAILERSSGKFIEVRYKEYLHSLPWRGMSHYVVVEVLKISDPGPASLLPY